MSLFPKKVEDPFNSTISKSPANYSSTAMPQSYHKNGSSNTKFKILNILNYALVFLVHMVEKTVKFLQ